MLPGDLATSSDDMGLCLAFETLNFVQAVPEHFRRRFEARISVQLPTIEARKVEVGCAHFWRTRCKCLAQRFLKLLGVVDLPHRTVLRTVSAASAEA
jgi:hypothetical protein